MTDENFQHFFMKYELNFHINSFRAFFSNSFMCEQINKQTVTNKY